MGCNPLIIGVLGGGASNIFDFHPENWGYDPIWLIFLKWVELKPPTRVHWANLLPYFWHTSWKGCSFSKQWVLTRWFCHWSTLKTKNSHVFQVSRYLFFQMRRNEEWTSYRGIAWYWWKNTSHTLQICQVFPDHPGRGAHDVNHGIFCVEPWSVCWCLSVPPKTNRGT